MSWTAAFNAGRMDDLGRLDSGVHRLDARAKILATAVFLVAVMSFPRHEVSALMPLFLFPAGLGMAGMGLSPFVVWWSGSPGVAYFAVNAVLHYAAVLGLMVGVLCVALSAARWLGDEGLRKEVRAGIGMVGWLSACTVGALLWMYYRSGVLAGGWLAVLAHVARLPQEAHTLFLLPYVGTAYGMWRVKDGALRGMAGGGAVAPQ